MPLRTRALPPASSCGLLWGVSTTWTAPLAALPAPSADSGVIRSRPGVSTSRHRCCWYVGNCCVSSAHSASLGERSSSDTMKHDSSKWRCCCPLPLRSRCSDCVDSDRNSDRRSRLICGQFIQKLAAYNSGTPIGLRHRGAQDVRKSKQVASRRQRGFGDSHKAPHDDRNHGVALHHQMERVVAVNVRVAAQVARAVVERRADEGGEGG